LESSEFAYLLLAFAGGIVGAAFGGLNVFILCGVSAVIGTIHALTTGDQSFNNAVTWGPFLSPHISFAGAVAGAAFAAKKGLLKSGKDISSALMGKNLPSILFVGGVFGLIGELLRQLLQIIPLINGYPATNNIALALVLSALIVRLAFGSTGLLGVIPENQRRWKFIKQEAWHPWNLPALQLTLVGIGFSLPAAFINVSFPESTALVFGFAAISLIFLQIGYSIPVTHHIVLAAEYGAFVTGNLWWGAFFGLLSAFIGEFFAHLFLNHGDTHIDPPAAALAVIFTIVPIVSGSAIIQLDGFEPFGIFMLMAFTGYVFFQKIKK